VTLVELQMLDNIIYILKNINAEVLAECIQILDEITYNLRAHRRHHISRILSDTQQDHEHSSKTPTFDPINKMLRCLVITYRKWNIVIL